MVGKEVKPLRYWVQKVLPLVYDDSLSYYELLDKVVYKLNELVASNDELVDYVGPFSDKINAIEQELKELLDGGYIEMIQKYMAEAIKHVYFGLTNAGYFAAYIPDNWSDLHFSTISDYSSELYGHLVLMYD